MQWIYGVSVEEIDGDFVVTVRDLPEVVTSGSTLDEAKALAADAIVTIVAGKIEDGSTLALPSPVEPTELSMPLAPALAAKASVYVLWSRAGISKSELARRMQRNENEVRRILNPYYATKLDQLQEAAQVLGASLILGFEHDQVKTSVLDELIILAQSGNSYKIVQGGHRLAAWAAKHQVSQSPTPEPLVRIIKEDGTLDANLFTLHV